jgi:Asp-tRNA(Asn)/Glu-tRNA(Gln) amidotransferase A subunit family amidase
MINRRDFLQRCAAIPQNTSEGGRGNTGGPGTPVSITFLGRLYENAKRLAFAQKYQQKTPFHTLHPKV